MKQKITYIVMLAIAVLGVAALKAPVPVSAAAQTFTVNSVGTAGDVNNGDGVCETNTPGECTFNAAVNQANANGNPADQDIINFTIPGAGVHTISPSSVVEIGEPVLINGYTQPGASQNTTTWPAPMDAILQIEIDCSSSMSGCIFMGSHDVTIRGLNINNSVGNVITLGGGTTNFNLLGNYINTDPTGLISEYGPDGGFAVQGYGSNHTIGTSSPEDRNILTGNRGMIGLLNTQGASIQGNYLGVGADGVTAMPSVCDCTGGRGVIGGYNASNTTIGGSGEGEGNTIENGQYIPAVAFGGEGVAEQGLILKGNRIVGNAGDHAVSVSQLSNVQIGGSGAYEHNVISGNYGSGLFLQDVSDVSLQGNYIGVAEDGVTAFSNNGNGVYVVNANDMNIGGASEDYGNTISSNASTGLILSGSSNVTIQHNHVGSGSDGVTSLPNGGNGAYIAAGENYSLTSNQFVNNATGIQLSNTNKLTLGGSSVGDSNEISGNAQQGIYVTEGAIDLTIKGNNIGVASDGITPFGNGGHGIEFFYQNIGASVGGTAPNEANVIANNGGDGISLNGNSNARVSLLGNNIYNNDDLGFDLNSDGVSSNDELDPDTQANQTLNFPELVTPLESGGDTNIGYRLDVPAGDYRIEFYSNTAPDPSGHGEGEELIGTQNITSAGAGKQFFSATLTGTGHNNIRATATEIDVEAFSGFGSTSEFSGASSRDNDLAISKTVVNQDTIVESGTIAYTVELTNNGEDALDLTQFTADPLDPLNTAMFNDIFPSNLTFSSVSGDADCNEQNSASTFGTLFSDRLTDTVLSCAYGGVDSTLAAGDSLSFTLNFSLTDPLENVFTNYVLNVPSVNDGSKATYDDAVSSGNDIITELGDTLDNLANDSTTANYDTAVTKEVVDQSTIPTSGTISYDVTFANNGPDTLNLDQFTADPLDPLNTAIFNDIFPNNLSLTSVTGDIDCSEQNPSEDFGTLFSGHSDHTVASCAYTGSDNSLASGESLDFSLTFTLTNPLLNVFDNSVIAIPLASDSGFVHYQNAINADSDILTYYNYDNIAVDSTTKPETDLAITTEVANPEDVAVGATLTYNYTYTNNGPDVFNLSEFSIPFGSNALFITFVAPDLTAQNILGDGPIPGSYFIDVGNPDLTCVVGGPGAAAGLTGESVNPDYGILACWYTGGDTSLAADGTVEFSASFQVANDSELAFSNYTIASVSYVSSDTDESQIIQLNNDYPANFKGAINHQNPPVNNFSVAQLSKDVGVTAAMVNPQDFAPGATIYYDVTLQNRGPAGVALEDAFDPANSLITLAYQANDLYLVGSTTPGVTCIGTGLSSTVILGAAAQDHPDHELGVCYDNGSGEIIAPGESYTIRLQMTVGTKPSNLITSYAINSTAYGDPDIPVLGQAVFGATEDILDTFQNDNYARVGLTYAGATGGTVNEESTSGDLSATGENVRKFIILAAGLAIAGGGILLVRKKLHNK